MILNNFSRSDTLQAIIRNSKDPKYEGNKKVFLENPDDDPADVIEISVENNEFEKEQKIQKFPKTWSNNVSSATQEFRQKYFAQLIVGY